MSNLITAQALSKQYGDFQALKDINLTVDRGEIIGLIGPNGAGKTSLLKSLLGLTHYAGELSIDGISPRHQREKLMQHLCFIADVAILPKWISVEEAVSFVEGVHPKFSREKAEHFLAKTTLQKKQTVGHLSKGMVVQLHLALIMAIDVSLLILDEPTLGLDILFRKQFYQNLLSEYYNENRTILITTHQIEEVENILTRVIMLNKGHIMLDSKTDSLHTKFHQVETDDTHKGTLDAMHPIAAQKKLGGWIYIFKDTSPESLSPYGHVTTPSMSDIFAAIVERDNA